MMTIEWPSYFLHLISNTKYLINQICRKLTTTLRWHNSEKMPKFHTNICTNFHRLRKIRNETSKYLNLFLQSLHLTSFLLSDLWRGEKRTFKIKSKFWQNESDRIRLRQAVNLLVTWTLFFESFCLKLHSSWKYFLSVELSQYSTALLFCSKCHYNVEVELYT